MLHDVVLALGGVGGDILKRLLNEEVLSISFAIHPCEKNILSEIVSIADNYKYIQGFLKKVPFFGGEPIVLDNGHEVTPGMYLRAFCNGTYDCLEPYRKHLIRMEHRILEEPHFTLPGILAEMSDFVPLLTTLKSIINQITSRRIHGCKILQLLHQHSSTGIEMVDEAIGRIKQSCHLVMLKQLTSFLLYGQLIDPKGEFFIAEQPAHHASTTTLDSESIPDTKSLPENVKDYSPDKTSIPDYVVVQDMVPCYIPISIPEKARFIGITVVLFSRDPRSKKSGVDIKRHHSVYEKIESSFLNQLKEIQKASLLDVSFLETVIDNIQTCVTQHLFSLAKDEANLRGELQLIKDYFLLGRGELFVVFLRRASGLLMKPVSSKNQGRELDTTLYMSVRNVHLDSDLIVERFSFKVPPKEQLSSNSTTWKEMVLRYSPPWPLHMLFTPQVLHIYDRLFNFLLQVKMAELNLHNVWSEHSRKKDNMLPPKIWTLRNILQFLIGNLQCYLQLDVIESRFTKLQAALDQTQDFQQVIHHHSIFLTDVVTEAFVDIRTSEDIRTVRRHPVNKCLLDILRLCDEFCAEMSRNEIRENILDRITSELDMNISVLMNLITVLGNKATGLRLLLLRLDYNRQDESPQSSNSDENMYRAVK